MKRNFSVLLCIILGLLLCSCEQGQSQLQHTPPDTNTVYTIDKSTYEASDIHRIAFCGDSLYGFHQNGTLVVFDKSGVPSQVNLGLENTNVLSVCTTQNAQIHILCNNLTLNKPIVYTINRQGQIESQLFLDFDEGSAFIKSFTVDSFGNILILTSNVLYSFDNTGKEQYHAAGSFVAGMCSSESFVVCINRNFDTGYYEINKLGDNGCFELLVKTDVALPVNSDWFSACPGSDNRLYWFDSNGAYSWDYEDCFEMLFDWQHINCDYPSDVAPYSAMRFAACWDGELHGIISGESGKTVDENGPVLLAIISPDDESALIRSAVRKYNETHTGKTIKVKNYMDGNTSISEAVTELNLDIVSGNIPDILDVKNFSANLYSNYENKGIFYELSDALEDIDMENLFDNVVLLGTTESSFYSVVPAFSLCSFFSDSETIGNKSSCTINELSTLQKELPDDTCIFGYGGVDLLKRYCALYINEFVDYKSVSCDFEGSNFEDLLTFCKEQEGYAIRPNNVLSFERFGRLSTFGSILRMFYASAENAPSFISISGQDNGHSAIPTARLSVMAQSENKETALDFFEFLLSDEFQSQIQDDFPVSRKVTSDQVDMMIEQGQMSNIKSAIIDAVDNIHCLYSNDYDILNIIEEEAAIYFAGGKTAKETATIIQNRVQTYLAEQQ